MGDCSTYFDFILQNYNVTENIQKVAEAFDCKPVEGKRIGFILLIPNYLLLSL